MDKFVTITKPGALANSGNDDTKRKQFKYNPYPIPKAKERQIETWRDKKRTEKIIAPLREEKKLPSGAKALTKHLLSTLKEETNPITHSAKALNPEHVDSCTTGHQRSDSRRFQGYYKSRNQKLENQRQANGRDDDGVLLGIRVYIGGYMRGTTDIEMKRIVTMAGGKIMNMAAGATHILTSQGLSGSKTHKFLHSNTRQKTHVVTPEWVFDSIAAGKRKKESDYAVIKDSMYGPEDLGIGSSHAARD